MKATTSSRLLQLAIDHACNQMGVKTITLGVFADNPSALKCYQSAGFKITGEDSYMIDGGKWKGYEMELMLGWAHSASSFLLEE